MRKTISASKDVSVLFITPGKAVWCSRFYAPLHSKKWHLKVWLAGTLCWLKDFCPYLLSAFLGQTRGSKYHHQRKQQEVRSSSSSLFTGLVGFRTKLCYFQVSFFCYWNSLSVCHRTDVRQLLWRWVWRVWKWGWRCSEKACENSLVRLFPKRCHALVCKASSSCCLSCG